jgi:phosphatidylserine decarboxylase
VRNENTPILREGWPFIIPALIVLALLVVLHAPAWLTAIWLLLTVFVVAFFRNPERRIPPGEELIACPADGEVVVVDEVDEQRFGLGRCRRVCIFMSPFNVHVNRAPVGGRVSEVRYRPGRYYVASDAKASEHNEQCALVLETPDRRRVLVVQIAGMLARRIVTYPRPGDELVKGQRFGLIRFGSRVDLYLPFESTIDVVRGDRVFGGSTVIGRMPHDGKTAATQG